MSERLMLELLGGGLLLCIGYLGERIISWARKHHELRKPTK